MGQVNGKNVWLFVTKVQERNLLELDEKGSTSNGNGRGFKEEQSDF